MTLRNRFGARLATIAGLVGVLLATCGATAWGATYYSQGSVAPNLVANWNTVRGGGGSAPVNFTSGDVFVIQNGHTMTTTATWSILGTNSKLWIEGGGNLVAGSGTTANALVLTSATAFQIDANGTYTHNNTAAYASAGPFPTGGLRTFDPASTVILNATNNSLPSNNIAFGNLTVNLTTAPTANMSWAGNLQTVNGNFTVTNTGGFEMRLAASTTQTLTVAKDLIINGGNLQLGSGAGVTTLNIGYNFIMTSGTFGSSSTAIHSVIFTGGSPLVGFTRSGGILTNSNMNWQIGAGKTLVLINDLTVATGRTLALGSGTIITNANKVIVSGATLTRTTGYVSGNLQKSVSGAGTVNFEIGSTSGYTPVSVNFASVGGAGNLTAGVATPISAPPTGSGLSASKYVNRSWTLTNGGIASPSYQATFSFINPGDLLGGATPASLIVAKDSGTWSNPGVSGTTSNSVTTTAGQTSFSDFYLGEPAAVTYTVAYAGNGNTGGTAPVDGSSPYNSGSTVTVLGNTGSLVKTGYTFANWNTAADGSGTS